MGKKRTLAIILLLCVLGGLIACGRKEKEDRRCRSRSCGAAGSMDPGKTGS